MAEACFEVVVRNPKLKDCYDALRLLAMCKARVNKPGESIELFKRVLELNPKDFEANIEIAKNYDQTDPKFALVYYEKALGIMKSEGDGHAPPEILINVGTLCLEVGKIDEAKPHFIEAIEACDRQLATFPGESQEALRLKAIKITARFNLGYWYEVKGQFAEATEAYKSIKEDEPSYLDAYLRLAYMARDRGAE
jgi:tetratricopeptide (TPR) repeat protein